VLASSLHWRLLIGTILVLMAAAWLAPRWIAAPGIDENRVLAPAPAWPHRLSELATYRKAADAYVGDHFPSRPHLIGLLNRARMAFGVSGSSRVIVGRDGWLFFDNDSHLGDARNDPPITGPEIRRWLVVFAGRTEKINALGATYLVFSPPYKDVMHPREGPAWYRGPSPRRAALTLPPLATATGVGEIVYPYVEIRRATDAGQPTYVRNDTHWSGFGAYAGYVALMNALHAKGLTEGPLPLSAFQRIDPKYGQGPRDLALMLGVANLVRLDYPNFDNTPGQVQLRRTYLSAKQDWTSPQIVDTGKVGKPVLQLTRDSYSNELLPFLYPHFSRIILSHNQDGFWRPDLTERFRPNIVVSEVIEPGLRVSMGDGPKGSEAAVARIDRVLGTVPAPPPPPEMPTLITPDAKTAQMLAAAVPTDNCHLEKVALNPGVRGQSSLDVSGWLSELATRVTAPQGFIALKGTGGLLLSPIRMDAPRPDVAAFYKNPNARQSGFVGTFFIAKLPRGKYTVSAYRRSSAGWIACVGKESLSAP
jgi:hypothetical protein